MTIKNLISDMLNDYGDFSYDNDQDKTLKELGLDSLDQMELFYYLREKLDISDDVPQGMKVSQIVAFIEYNHGKKIYGTV